MSFWGYGSCTTALACCLLSGPGGVKKLFSPRHPMVESNATVKAVLSKSLFLLRAMIANPFESSVGKVGAYEVLSAGTKRNPILAATTLRLTRVKRAPRWTSYFSLVCLKSPPKLAGKMFHTSSDCPNHSFHAGKCISMTVLFSAASTWQFCIAAGNSTVSPVERAMTSSPKRKVALPFGIVTM